MYDIKFYAYCGMSYNIAENLTREEVIEKLKKKIASARKSGKVVSHIGKNTWEFESPENAGMVSDNEGILKILRKKKSRFR